MPQKPLVVPVPLDRQRLRERGFNQSQLLAQEVARAYKWPLNNKILTRTRHTLPQAGLSATDRWSNVAGAFIAVNCERLKGKEILLIDDIYTTGSTVDAASKALTKAGAGGVYVATVAIASSHPKARPNKF
ncbi:MAG: ComF family protein [bacterium]